MIINNINTEEITFVVQGAIDPVNTPKCLDSIRTNFPNSTIVLSTWKNSKTFKLTYDKLVENDDPGACVYDKFGTLNNINRQLLSTKSGLKEVRTKFAAKVRSDLIFDGPNFLYFFDAFPLYEDGYKAVKSRLVTLAMYSRRFHVDLERGKVINLPFYFSDWFLFGYVEDICKVYDIDLIENLSEFSSFYLEKDYNDENFPFHGYWAEKTPENYIAENFFSRFLGYSVYPSRLDNDNKVMNISRHLIANNFIILDYQYSKIYSGKRREESTNEWCLLPLESVGLYFYSDFLYDYKKFCNPNYSISKEFRKQRALKLKLVYLFLIGGPLWAKIKNKLAGFRTNIKKLMKIVFPTYRVSCGIRERIEVQLTEQGIRLTELNEQVDEINRNLDKLVKSTNKEV